MNEGRVEVMTALFGDNIQTIITEANRLKVRKNDVVSFMKDEKTSQYFLIYYKAV